MLHERDGDFFFSPKISAAFALFLQCCCAVLCFLFLIYILSKEENKYLTWDMYVRTACERV